MNKNAKARFELMCTAALEHELCLAKCTDIRTQKPAYVVCAIDQTDGFTKYIPLARLFTSDPLNEISPPGQTTPLLL